MAASNSSKFNNLLFLFRRFWITMRPRWTRLSTISVQRVTSAFQTVSASVTLDLMAGAQLPLTLLCFVPRIHFFTVGSIKQTSDHKVTRTGDASSFSTRQSVKSSQLLSVVNSHTFIDQSIGNVLANRSGHKILKKVPMTHFSP